MDNSQHSADSLPRERRGRGRNRSRDGNRSRGRSGSTERGFDIVQPGDPLYLHHNEQFWMMIVPEKLLGTENFAEWSRDMKIALLAKNKFGIVDGSVPRPNPNSSLFAHWQRCNAVVLGWLLSSLSPEIYKTFTYSTDARQVWDHLQQKYRHVGLMEIAEVQRDIASTTQHGEPIDNYVFRLERLWNRQDSFIAINHPALIDLPLFRLYQEHMRIFEFLQGLDNVYNIARFQIKNAKPLPSLSEAISKVRDEETSRLLSGSQNRTDTLAFQLQSGLTIGTASCSSSQAHAAKILSSNSQPIAGSKDSAVRSDECAYCGKKGHRMEECYMLTRCAHCGILGHKKDKCYKLHGRPGRQRRG